MTFKNKLTLYCFHILNGYCEHCHANRMVLHVTPKRLKKYNGPFCKECGHKLDI